MRDATDGRRDAAGARSFAAGAPGLSKFFTLDHRIGAGRPMTRTKTAGYRDGMHYA